MARDKIDVSSIILTGKTKLTVFGVAALCSLVEVYYNPEHFQIHTHHCENLKSLTGKSSYYSFEYGRPLMLLICVHIMSWMGSKGGQNKKKKTRCFCDEKPIPEVFVHLFSYWWNIICGSVNEELFCAGVGIRSKPM